MLAQNYKITLLMCVWWEMWKKRGKRKYQDEIEKGKEKEKEISEG